MGYEDKNPSSIEEIISSKTPVKRKKLEIIFDTCVAGEKIVDGISKLATYSVAHGMFEKFSFVIPLQIATELKERRIFKEILERTLKRNDEKEDGVLHRFYQRFHENIKIVDTEVSHSYRMKVSFKAIEKLEKRPELKGIIAAEAALFSAKYFPEKQKTADSAYNLSKLEDFINVAKNYQSAFEKDVRRSKRKVYKFLEGEGFKQLEIEDHLREIEQKKLARFGKKFFRHVPASYQMILQSIYLNRTFAEVLKNDAEFKQFRRDKGERAIEDYLYSKRNESDPNIVTLIISDDEGARKSIQYLRHKTKNTVFVLSGYGLAHCLKELNLTKEEVDIIGQNKMNDYRSKVNSFENKKAKGYTYSDRNIEYPEIELKWANRLIEVLHFGRWAELE